MNGCWVCGQRIRHFQASKKTSQTSGLTFGTKNVIQLSTRMRKDQKDHRPVGLSSAVYPFFVDVRRCLMDPGRFGTSDTTSILDCNLRPSGLSVLFWRHPMARITTALSYTCAMIK